MKSKVLQTKIERGLRWLALAATAMTALVQCSDASNLSLRDSPPGGSPSDEDPEVRRLKQMQNVQYKEAYSCGDGVEHVRDAETVLMDWGIESGDPFAYACMGTEDPFPSYGYYGFQSAAILLCRAKLHREGASSARAPMVLKYQRAEVCGTHYSVVDVTATVPVQGRAASQVLVGAAVQEAHDAVSDAKDGFGDVMYFDAGTVTSEDASAMSGMIAGAIQLEAELSDSFVQFTVDVADAQRSSSLSIDVATGRAITGPYLSRAEAAHALVGGNIGLSGIAQKALCTSPELTPQARAAVEIFRLAAPPPADIRDTTNITTDSLVNGPRASGSVKERLNELYSRNITVKVEDAYQLRLDDFEEARRYLKDESFTFSRSLTKVTPKLKKPNGIDVIYDRFASVANAPPLRAASYWAAIARYAGSDTLPYQRGVARNRILEEDLAVLEDFIPNGQYSLNGLGQDIQDAALAALELQANELREQYLGRIRGTTAGASPQTFTLENAGGSLSTAGWRMLIGDDALSCAVYGSVENVPCTAANLDSQFTPANSVGMTLCNFQGTTCTPPSLVNILALRTRRLYVVRPKRSPTAPGDWEALVGIPVLSSDSSYQDTAYAIVPQLEQRVAEVLAPNREWCTHSQLSCAGAEFDERLPLENELAETGDGVESSWKHYLQRAKDAAKEADELGSEYIRASFDIDLRKEEQELLEERRRQEVEETISELQDLCGTNVDPIQLLTLLSGSASGDDLANLRQKNGASGVSCTSNSNCAAGFSCIASACLKRPGDVLQAQKATLPAALKESLSRLDECIGPDAEHDFVTLGDAPVCIWYPTGTPSKMCEGADKTRPCPRLKEDSETTCFADTSKLPSPAANYTPLAVGDTPDTRMGYFHSKSGNTTPPPTVCTNLRGLRDAAWPNAGPALTGGYRKLAFDGIVGSDLLHPWKLLELGEGVGFVAFPGGRASITLDDDEVYTTRTCPSCDKIKALGWCTSTCSSADDIATANQRMLGAVMALRLSTTASLEKISLPFYVKGYASGGPSTITTYPGTSTPMKKTVVDAGELPCYWAGKAQFEVMETDSTATLPAIWHNKGQDLFLAKDGYKFAIGNVASGRAMTGPCSKDVRALSLWKGLSTASDFGLFEDMVWSAQSGPSFRSDEGPLARSLRFPASADPQLGYKYVLLSPRVEDDGKLWFTWGALRSAYGVPASQGLSDDLLISVDSGDSLPSSNEAAQWVTDMQSPRQGGNAVVREAKRGCGIGSDCGGCTCKADFAQETKCVCGGGNPWEPPPSPSTPPPPPPPMRYLAQSIMGYDNSVDNYLDAAQLACDLTLYNQGKHCDPEHPPELVSNRDLGRMKEFLECAATSIEQRAATLVLAHMPKRAMGGLIDAGEAGAFPALGGDMGTAVSSLRASLVQVSRIGHDIAHQVALLGDDLDQVRIREEQFHVHDQIASVEFRSSVMNYATQCANAIASVLDENVVDLFGGKATSKSLQAAFTCANAIVQVEFGSQLRDLKEQDNALDMQLVVNDLRTRFRTRSNTVAGLKSELIKQLEGVNAQLSTIETLRNKARRVLSRALYKATAQAKSEATVNTVYSNRAAVSEERYQRAFRNAVKLSFLAKRAIETRLGIRLSEMREDLPLVGAPSSWEGTLCTMTGINYAALQKDMGEGAQKLASDVADQFIGEYVTKLENLVESYRLTNGFHEGQDTAVISLKDDMFRVSLACNVPSANLLYDSSQLNQYEPATQHGWRVEGCNVGADGVDYPQCVTVGSNQVPAGEPVPPAFTSSLPDLEKAQASRIQLGPEAGGTCAAPACGYKAGASLVQRVPLAAGNYVLSWYYFPLAAGEAADGGTGDTGFDAMDAVGDDNTALTTATLLPGDTSAGVTGWIRYSRSFTVDVPRTMKIRMGGKKVSPTKFMIAAPMLEPAVGSGTPKAGDYEFTDSKLEHSIPTCGDKDGNAFRSKYWTHGCVRVCTTGFGAKCDDQNAAQACYHEASFELNEREVEMGRALKAGSLAIGNFNYRTESLGVNFVGTNIVRCAAGSSDSCYSQGNIQYSLEHAGPYIVRNQMGQEFKAELFQGNIEHARGLSLERYFTNPMSSGDSALIAQNTRHEFQGRPLDGNYRLRVWDADDVDFDAIKDVQIVWNYRYWTRFD